MKGCSMNLRKTKRLLLEVTPELHGEVKIRAARRNISIKKWIERAIMDAIKNEEQYT